MANINENYKYLLKPQNNFTFYLYNYYTANYNSGLLTNISDENDYFKIGILDGIYDNTEYTKNIYTDENLKEVLKEYKFTDVQDSSELSHAEITIGGFNYNFEDKAINNVDNIRNSTELFNINILYSKNPSNPGNTWLEYLFNNTALFNIYPVLQQFADAGESISDQYLNFADLYDFDFSKYIYRANPNNTLNFTNLNQDIYVNTNITLKSYSEEKIPVFMYKTTNPDIMFFLSCRNIYIPYKKILSAQINGEYTYIFIYPEYMFKNNTGNTLHGMKEILEYSSAIFSTEKNVTIKYSYIKENELYPNEFNSYNTDFSAFMGNMLKYEYSEN